MQLCVNLLLTFDCLVRRQHVSLSLSRSCTRSSMSFQSGASSPRRVPKGKIKAPKKVRETFFCT
jgi:hypothetical protein